VLKRKLCLGVLLGSNVLRNSRFPKVRVPFIDAVDFSFARDFHVGVGQNKLANSLIVDLVKISPFGNYSC